MEIRCTDEGSVYLHSVLAHQPVITQSHYVLFTAKTENRLANFQRSVRLTSLEHQVTLGYCQMDTICAPQGEAMSASRSISQDESAGSRDPAFTLASGTAVTSVSVVVPTRNEAENVDALLDRLGPALSGIPAEVIFVDDSDDETPQVVLRRVAAPPQGLSVRLVHRAPAERAGGLGSAVLAGVHEATGDWVVVMDGDLQHPPEVIQSLVDAGESADVDVVVASRHVTGGDSGGLSGRSRVLVSGWATRCAKIMFPVALRGVSDPMSGFFAVRRSTVDPATLRPDGFKILIEILVRSPGLRRTEVGFVFEKRVAGESKASFAEGMRFFRHLARLSGSRIVPQRRTTQRAIGFAAVGASGMAVNTGALWLFADGMGLNYLVAAVLATQVSTTWNFLFVDRFVFRGAKTRRPWHRYLIFSGVNNLVLLARLPVLALLVAVQVNYLLANLITLVLSFIFRFATSDRFIYKLEK